MNILILGGNGYLGSKVARALVDKHNVILTKRRNADMSRLEDIKDRFIWVSSSLDAIETVLIYTSIDIVINMISDYGRSNVLYSNVMEANLEFPLKILDKVSEYGVKSFITIGTGLPDELNMYAFSKKNFAEFGRYYAEKGIINFVNLKLEMFYGADEPLNRFLPGVINKMILGEEVNTTIGTQKRDIICVDDIVSAILLVIESNLNGYHEIAVGTGESPSISEIVDFIWENTGKKSKINKGVIPMREDEPDCVADTTEIEKLGEWRPVKWKNGILKMITDMYKEV